MEAYLQAKKERYIDVADLQDAVAERLIQLGETDKGFDFAKLAGETRNAELIHKSSEMSANIASEQMAVPRRMEEVVDGMKGAVRGFNETVESMGSEFRSSVNRLDSSIQDLRDHIRTFDGAANTIGEGARRIDQAAGQISEASYRMRGSGY